MTTQIKYIARTIPLALVMLTAATCPPPPDPVVRPFAGYMNFGLEGGYQAGTVVDASIQPVLFYHDWKDLPVKKSDYPKGTFNFTTVAANFIRANASVVGIDAMAANIDSTILTIEDGYIGVVSLASLLEHIQTLELATRDILGSILEEERSSDDSSIEMMLLTEVIVVSKGSLYFRFTNAVEASVGTTVSDLLKMELISFDGTTMQLSYTSDTVVGYKSTNQITTIIEALDKEPTEIYYRDQDGDGVGGNDVRKDFVEPVGYVKATGDCLDVDSNVFPGQEAWFDTPNRAGHYDYNCDGEETAENTNTGSCRGNGTANQGWLGGVPSCGASQRWLVDCDRKITGTVQESDTRRQKCK